jgi:high-affinity nickel permease
MIEAGILTVLALGFVLGMKHALDADHVVAVSTIVSKNRSLLSSSIIGAFWGIGHTATLFLAGFLFLTLKVTIPEQVALLLEMAVGVMLVFLGGVVAAGLIKERLDYHLHQHDGQSHVHVHKHAHVEPHQHQHAIRRGYRSMAIGMVHGLAGSAALMLLVVSSIRSVMEGFLYIIIFGAGSVVGMMMITTLISLPFVYTAFHFNRLNRTITAFASMASIVLGTAIIYEIGFVQGLF